MFFFSLQYRITKPRFCYCSTQSLPRKMFLHRTKATRRILFVEYFRLAQGEKENDVFLIAKRFRAKVYTFAKNYFTYFAHKMEYFRFDCLFHAQTDKKKYTTFFEQIFCKLNNMLKWLSATPTGWWELSVRRRLNFKPTIFIQFFSFSADLARFPKFHLRIYLFFSYLVQHNAFHHFDRINIFDNNFAVFPFFFCIRQKYLISYSLKCDANNDWQHSMCSRSKKFHFL